MLDTDALAVPCSQKLQVALFTYWALQRSISSCGVARRHPVCTH